MHNTKGKGQSMMSSWGRMFSLLSKKPQQPPLERSSKDTDNPVSSDYLIPANPDVLLSTPRRQKLLTHIWQRTSVSRPQFEALYLQPIKRYASLVQMFPASQSHHHAYPGGMLDHGLEIVAYALKLRQSHLLPVGSSPETQAAQGDAWTAGVVYAALLHDIGKIAVDLHVEYANGQIWHPWHGQLVQPYRFSYLKHREYRLHSASSGLLYRDVLDSQTLDWLSGFQELWTSFLFVLAGHNEHAGILGELVIKADQASVAQELGGDPAKVLAAPKHALQRKLLDGLRFLLKDSLKLNQPEASDGWLTDDALWLVSKTVSDKLRAHLLAQGIDGIPASNTAVFNVLQEHGIALPSPDGKAIWSATVNSDKGWSNTFTFLKLAPAIIWQQVNERPTAFTGTVIPKFDSKSGEDTAIQAQTSATAPHATTKAHTATQPPADDGLSAVLDLLGDLGNGNSHEEVEVSEVEVPNDSTEFSQPQRDTKDNHTPKALVLPSQLKPKKVVPALEIEVSNHDAVEPSGPHFMSWLKDSILTQKLIINEAKAMIHTVDNTLYLVTPSIFNRYAQEHVRVKELAKAVGVTEWRWTQKEFEQLMLHRKQPDGLNIWKCMVEGPRKTRHVYGYLLKDAAAIVPDIQFNNPYLKMLTPGEAGKLEQS